MKNVLFCSFILLSLAFFGCKKEKTPTACLTFDYYYDHSDITNLKNCSTDADHYKWDFGDGVTSAEFEPGYTGYYTPGTYTIKLTAYSTSEKKTDVAMQTVIIN